MLKEMIKKMAEEEGSYKVKLITGDEFRFSRIDEFDDGWIKVTLPKLSETVLIRINHIVYLIDESDNAVKYYLHIDEEKFENYIMKRLKHYFGGGETVDRKEVLE